MQRTIKSASASDCVADASSIANPRNENDLLNAAACDGLDRDI